MTHGARVMTSLLTNLSVYDSSTCHPKMADSSTCHPKMSKLPFCSLARATVTRIYGTLWHVPPCQEFMARSVPRTYSSSCLPKMATLSFCSLARATVSRIYVTVWQVPPCQEFMSRWHVPHGILPDESKCV